MSEHAKMQKRLRQHSSPHAILSDMLVYLLLIVLSLFWVFPLAWVVMTSLRSEPGSYFSSFLPTTPLTLDNYRWLFNESARQQLDFPRMFQNTFFIAIFTCIISTTFVLSVAYAMSRRRFKMRRPLMNINMVLGLFPGFMSMIAVYFILKALGLTEAVTGGGSKLSGDIRNLIFIVYGVILLVWLASHLVNRVRNTPLPTALTRVLGVLTAIGAIVIVVLLFYSYVPRPIIALIIVYSAGSGSGFLLLKGYMDTIPKSLDEAAIIDGATHLQSFIKIILPISRPMIVYQVLTSFLGPWLDFIMARVITGANNQYYTVAVGLWSMLDKERTFVWYKSFAAGAVLVSIPIAILTLIMQRFYSQSMSGAVKG